MPFVLNPNCEAAIWVGVGSPPWETGDPPDYEGVPLQKMKPWLAVSPDQHATSLWEGGQAIARFLMDETPLATGAWLALSGSNTFLGIVVGEAQLYYLVLGVDHWFEEGELARQWLWANLAFSG